MELKAEAIDNELLHHSPHLRQAGHSGRVRLGGNVELLGVKPCWSVNNLFGMQVVAELDQIGQSGVESVQHAALIDADSPTRPVWVRWLDRRYFELRLRARVHHLRRGRRLGNSPGCVGRSFHKSQWTRFARTPGAVHGAAVAAEGPLVGSVQRWDTDFDCLTARFNRLRLDRSRVLI